VSSRRPASGPAAGASRDLARRIRASRVLTPALRRYWLAVLPHLEPEDRERLETILRRAAPAAPAAPDPGRSGNSGA
jgi:hypothetical protein